MSNVRSVFGLFFCEFAINRSFDLACLLQKLGGCWAGETAGNGEMERTVVPALLTDFLNLEKMVKK